MTFDRNSTAFRDICSRFGVDEKLVAAIVTVESHWDPFAFNYEPTFSYPFKVAEFAHKFGQFQMSETVLQKSSFGLMQIMGGTARFLGFKEQLGMLFLPEVGIEYGVRYLVTRMNRYDKLEDVISAYNRGSARRDPLTGKYLNNEYVEKVLDELGK